MDFSVIKAIVKKYPDSKHAAHLENETLVFDQWECPSHPQPLTEQEILAAVADLDAADQSEKQKRRQRKKAIMQKLNLSKPDLRALKELLDDGDDDN